jgi:uncharacterized BrkB/YihY/UPF0761 family membrane protein
MEVKNSFYAKFLKIILVFSVISLITWIYANFGTSNVGNILAIPYVLILLVSPVIAFFMIIYCSFGVIYQWVRPKQKWGLKGIGAWMPLVIILISIFILIMCSYFWSNFGFSA